MWFQHHGEHFYGEKIDWTDSLSKPSCWNNSVSEFILYKGNELHIMCYKIFPKSCMSQGRLLRIMSSAVSSHKKPTSEFATKWVCTTEYIFSLFSELFGFWNCREGIMELLIYISLISSEVELFPVLLAFYNISFVKCLYLDFAYF